MLGLHATSHTLFIKGDLERFSMRKHTQTQLIKFLAENTAMSLLKTHQSIV